MPTTNPPTAKVLVQAMAKIVERRTKTKQNLDKAKNEKDALVKKSKPSIHILATKFIN
jgi:hypothetical protein